MRGMSFRLSPRLPGQAASAPSRARTPRAQLCVALPAALVALLGPLALLACSDGVEGPSSASSGTGTGAAGGGGSGGNAPVVEALHPDAPPLPGETECVVEITTNITFPSATHMPLCTPIDYPTNPPAGGPHWGQWAAFKQYTTPVPREMYVHDMEHGAVVLAYRCDGECAEVTDFLGEIYDGRPADPLCVVAGLVEHRLVVTPDAELDVPVAAAAWGATYRATCLDEASLVAFIDAHYGKGPEQICAQGKDIEADGGVGCP